MVVSWVVELPASWWQQVLSRYVLACPLWDLNACKLNCTTELHAVFEVPNDLILHAVKILILADS